MFMKKNSPVIEESLLKIEVRNHSGDELISDTTFSNFNGNSDFYVHHNGNKIIDKISPFDTFIKVIEGMAGVVTDERSHILKAGESMIIPANTFYRAIGNEDFKMTSIVIVQGYSGTENIIDGKETGAKE